jgi:hypothetical protein
VVDGFSQIEKLLSQGIGCLRKLRLFGSVLGFATGAQKTVAGVLDFAGHNLPANGGRAGRVVGGAELGSAQGDAGISHAGDAGLQIAILRQKVDGDAMFPAKVHRRGADARRSENTNRFQMVDRDRQFSRLGGRFPMALFRRQIGWIDWNFHLKGQMITSHIGARCREIKRILLQVQAS